MALKAQRKTVFLYNYNVQVWCIKEGYGHRFRCLLKQHETDVQSTSTSNRKLPNFYEKVTMFATANAIKAV